MEIIATLLAPFLNLPYILRIRRNHGLEHGTIHLLNRQRYTPSGRAGSGGFIVIGDVPTEKITRAAHDALKRFRNGEKQLAIHPNCGTNLVTTGFILASIGAMGFGGTNRRSATERFPIVMLAMMIGAIYSLPIGMLLQKHVTTTADMGQLEVISVTRREISIPFAGKMVIHNITTHG
jgi:hypothetical protein